jgi:hypothetical protein
MILDNLLRSQERRARAQQDYYRAVCEYNKSIVQVHLLKGSLLEYNNICLQEGPWAEKAYWDAEGHAKRRDAARYMDYGASRPRVISEGAYQQHTGTAKNQVREGTASLKNSNSKNSDAIQTPSDEELDNLNPPKSELKNLPSPTTISPDNSTEELPKLKANSQANRRVFRQAGYIHTQPSTPSNVIR